ncbi:exodeoxyribonuclease I [Solemya velesiana gill symbiont]|uniref:Exodeoxyribonuclease I n=1 Tax=Solemya velesiana gill symbiont TaxID=1918948 RepID=A0A1T2KY13_9GAMM|nr:exodeoxyribonuclease I [Solemya velesiana gill symbiont]OOZ37735.1 exodeoxyribonuclease I [Solemya velesiana gill symbiont]
MLLTFYWHDYEAWGIDPRKDRASQFAGIRTDENLNIIGQPLVTYCKPADDMLPQPEACLVTGITPQKAMAEGVSEAEFFRLIHQELSYPGTCGVGYNTIRFDDEFTRHGFYRNFFDPYAREWQNGNSRWDIIDMVRLTRALRPEGIEWPEREPGVPSFKLEHLTQANSISHEDAHDALSDVHATIAIAKLIKERQPKLFQYIFQMRDKRKVRQLLNLREKKPVLHVSSMYPSTRGCIAMVVPLAKHPTNSNGVIVYDLLQDPEPLLTLSVEEIQQRLFTPRDQLPEGVEPIPLKTVHINKCPVIVPMNTMTDEAAARWQIDIEQGQRHLEQIMAAAGLEKKVQSVHSGREFEPITDPDQALYSGGFFSDTDRRRMEEIRNTEPQQLSHFVQVFDDARIPEMLFRYRARNWPETLSRDERARWDEYRRDRIMEPSAGGSITLDEYQGQLAKKMVDPEIGDRDRMVLSELADWSAVIGM